MAVVKFKQNDLVALKSNIRYRGSIMFVQSSGVVGDAEQIYFVRWASSGNQEFFYYANALLSKEEADKIEAGTNVVRTNA